MMNPCRGFSGIVKGESELSHLSPKCLIRRSIYITFPSRTWINIWLFDQSMSAQAGVRPSLNEQGIISSCSSWHESEFRVPGDGALVAQVQLRRVFTHHKELFERLGLLWHRNDSLSFDSTKLLNIEFYLKSLEDSYATWSSQWLQVEPGTRRGARLRSEFDDL